VSFRQTLKAAPTLFRVGFMQSIAYRAEMFVWILSSTMPLVMLALFTAVAQDGPLGRFVGADFTAYFLATFVVRQYASSWTSWQINGEVRDGTLSMRLLRPVSPILSYAIENLSYMPLRLVFAAPVTIIMVSVVGTDRLPQHAVDWLMFGWSWACAWMLTFAVHTLMGTLSLYMEQSMKLMDVWFAGYLVFSGYLVPIELFPSGLQEVVQWLPFHGQIGLPVEVLLGVHTRDVALQWMFVQAAWVVVIGGLAALSWRRGLARFAAVGG
jgi:ABC-2 type transport system permease protein